MCIDDLIHFVNLTRQSAYRLRKMLTVEWCPLQDAIPTMVGDR